MRIEDTPGRNLPAIRGGWMPATGSGMPNPEFQEAAENGPKVRLPKALWRGKWWMLAAVLTGTLAGFCWVLFNAPTFSTTALVELVGMNENFMGMNQIDPQAGTGNYSATAANVQTQSRILTSGTMLGRAIERVNLEMTPITGTPPDLFSKLRNRLGIVSQEPVEIMKQAVAQAAKSTKARGVGASRLLEISAESNSPEVAAAFVNTLASEYVSQSTQARSSSSLRTTQWLEGQLEEAKGRIEQAETKLQDFVQKEGLAFVLDQTTLADSKVRQLQAELSGMQAERIAKQSRWELAKNSSIDSLPEILDDGRMKELRGTLTNLRREKAQLTATLTPAHFKVQRIDAQIAEIEQTLHKEKANLVQRIQNDYEASLRREKMTSDSYHSQARSMAGQAGKAAQYALLKRESDLARQIYNNLLQQANQANVIAALPTTTIRIIEQAGVPSIPTRPVPARDIPLGGFLGAALAAGAIYMIELQKAKQLAKVFSTPGHIASSLHLPELGAIPALGAPVPVKQGLRIPFRKPVALPAPGIEDPKELVAWSQRASFSADSFRYTLTSLLGGDNPPRIVIITSPGPGEGKTTVSTNLAAAAASTGRKTLLIDGDVRRARLHKLFDTPLDPGLTELLTTDQLDRSVLLSEHIRPTGVPGMYLLPAGSLGAGESPAEILFSAKLASLLTALQREFDLILVDTAPALHFPDARLLGKFSDGVVLVVRSFVTQRETVQSVAQRFLVDRVPVLGTVLNDWAPEQDSAYGYAPYYSAEMK